jgi:hypothetical protein
MLDLVTAVVRITPLIVSTHFQAKVPAPGRWPNECQLQVENRIVDVSR